ncbi:hypothetical protein HW555_006167, partial [Spodoptera exigua]
DGKTNVICITSIETPDGCVYDVPDEQKNANKHTSIISLEVYAKIKNSLKKRHQTRKIWIPATLHLDILIIKAWTQAKMCSLMICIWRKLRRISNLPITIINLNQSTRTSYKLLTKKFSGRTSYVNQWIEEFETKCGRFEILQDESKIEILKHLLEKQCLDWYTVTKKNFTKFTKNVPDNTSKYQKEIACKICEKLNKGIRYHPEEKCWFKQTNDYENRNKYLKNVKNTVLDIELNENEQKNE